MAFERVCRSCGERKGRKHFKLKGRRKWTRRCTICRGYIIEVTPCPHCGAATLPRNWNRKERSCQLCADDPAGERVTQY